MDVSTTDLDQPLVTTRDSLLSDDTEEDSFGIALIENEDGTTKPSIARQAATLYAFTINYIIGAGVLGIPYAVAEGGLVATSALLVVSSSLCLMAMVWVLECQERANVMLNKPPGSLVEYSEMCRLFLGPRVSRVYEVALTVFVLCSSWMYAAIFSVSLSKTFPMLSNSTKCDLSSHKGPLWTVSEKSCWGDYLIYLSAFAVGMVFLVQTDIAKMKGLQLALTSIGLCALVTMIITVFVALDEDGSASLEDPNLYFNGAKFGSVFSSFVFAQLCHHGVPLLSQIPKEKRIIRPVFIGVISTTTTLYLILGITCAVFFGVEDMGDRDAVNKLITLDWQNYTGGKLTANAFVKFISYYVRLYPAVTCGAANPLYCITLGNGWHHAYYGSNDNDNTVPVSKNRFYVAAMLPPVLFATLMADVSFMLFFVGLSAFLIAFFIPPMMQLKSMELVSEMKSTKYSWIFSRKPFCYCCLGFGGVAFIYTIISLF